MYLIKYEITGDPLILKEIKSLQLLIIENNKPLIFRTEDNDNYPVNAEKQFDKSLAILEDNGFKVDKNISMYDYRVKLEYLEEKIKLSKSKNANKK